MLLNAWNLTWEDFRAGLGGWGDFTCTSGAWGGRTWCLVLLTAPLSRKLRRPLSLIDEDDCQDSALSLEKQFISVIELWGTFQMFVNSLMVFHFSNCNLQDSENTEQRIQSLISSLKHMVYEYVCRCLFKVRHVILFTYKLLPDPWFNTVLQLNYVTLCLLERYWNWHFWYFPRIIFITTWNVL